MKAIDRGEKVLEVKNLRISFRTNGGTVKAVRGISFSLYKGRTLAIVGESGSGKSVTSKAILGILANNKIIEDGQIIYDGKDLLQISEETFSKLRGVKLSMIFQDPLSSLNPIMIVGKQLTEAMILKTKATRKEARKNLKKFKKAFMESDEESTINLLGTIADDKDLRKYEPLFQKAARDSLDRRMEAASRAYDALVNYRETHLLAGFSIKEAYKAIKPLIPLVEACDLDVSVDPDDMIATFKTVLKDTEKKEAVAEKLRKAEEKDLRKYGAEDHMGLPPAVRAKTREQIHTEEENEKEFAGIIEAMIAHLEELSSFKNEDVEKLAKQIEKDAGEAFENKDIKLSKTEAKERAISLLREVGIDEPEKRYKQYPFELSGGMRQRIVIAIALSSSPEVLICDEPTTALDVTIQSQILELINKLKEERHLSIVFITHDLGVVANMADDIAVMYAGKIVERGTDKEIFYDPRHPYTWALLGSMPDLETKEKLHAIPGTPPNMLLPPRGDAFASRNEYALKIDELEEPPFFEVSPTHYAATWMLSENAPDVEVPEIVKERIEKALKEHPEAIPEPTNRKNSILNYIKVGKGGK